MSTSKAMKNIYCVIFLVFSVNGYSETAFEACRNTILLSKPYGENALVEMPGNIDETEKQIIINWGDSDMLMVTGKDGIKSVSLGRCVYNKASKDIDFLTVYADTIISMYANEIEQLDSSSHEMAMNIAKSVGLSELDIQWIKRNGDRDFIGHLRDEQNPIMGIENHSKNTLDKLDSLQIINVYPVQNKPEEFWSVSTDFSRALVNKL